MACSQNSITPGWPRRWFSPSTLRAEARQRPGALLYWILIREMAVPAFFTLGILAMLLLVQDLVGYVNLVVNRGVGVSAVGSFALFQALPVAGATLPFSMLVGCLAGLGRLAAGRELLAMEASGLSPSHLVGPIMSFAALASVLALALSLYAMPWSERELDRALAKLGRDTPAASIVADVVQRFGDWRLEARDVSSTGKALRRVMLFVPAVGETLFAERGAIRASGDAAELTLENATLLLDPRKQPRVLHFERARAILQREETVIERSPEDQLAGLSFTRLLELATDADKPRERATQALVQLQRRLALPIAPLVLGLLAVPLFHSRQGSTRAGGALLGIAATLSYYGLAQLGEGMTRAGATSLTLGVWLPNLTLGAVGVAGTLALRRGSTTLRDPSATREWIRSSHLPRVYRLRRAPRRWPLPKYVSGEFLLMVALGMALLLVGYLLVDLLERLDWFALHQPSTQEFLLFYAARLPLLSSRIIPMALLVATALTVSRLTAQGEITAMAACGIPASRGLAPILVLCACIVPVYFALSNGVLPHTNAYYDFVKSLIRGRATPGQLPGLAQNSQWIRSGQIVYEAAELDPQLGARELKIYELRDGRPHSRVDASEAQQIGSGIWRLHDPMRVEVGEDWIRELPAAPFMRLSGVLDKRVNTRHLGLGAIRREARAVEKSGLDANPLWVGYYGKWATPFSCLVLPAIALFFELSGPPYPSPSATAIASVLVAVGFVLTTGVAASLGVSGVVSPVVAGLSPLILFAFLAAFMGWRLRNRER